MIAGSSTASRPTSSLSRATARWCGSRATTPITKPTASAVSASRPRSRTASSTSPWCGRERRESAGGVLLAGLLAQELEESVDLAAVALDHRGEFLALGHRHADALDDDVGDLEALGGLVDAPIDLDRRSAARPRDDALHHRALAVLGARRRHLELLAAVIVEADRIGADDIGLEEGGEILALRLARRAPIAAEDEARDRRDVEAFLEDGAELRLALAFRGFGGQDPHRPLAEIGDEAGGVVGRVQLPGRAEGGDGEQDGEYPRPQSCHGVYSARGSWPVRPGAASGGASRGVDAMARLGTR